ncbi:MAG TPA: TIGR01777 family oxidoreductase [Blastocatellia bacterium]|nr:TIGR01777 family oxidoreductase [Blastocatellia bacterium]
MKLLITGATGLVGRTLCRWLKDDGHSIVALSRTPDPARVPQADAVFAWQPEAGMPPAAAFEGVDGVIHLAGESVAAQRWTAEHKRRVRDSRVLGTRHLVEAMQALAAPPKVFISASAVGFYGDRGDEVLDENSPPGHGFLSEVCVEWEREAQRAAEFSVRVALLRIGVVLSPQGGALTQMLPIFRLGLAGKLGSGRQWFPWIHLDDVVGIIRFTLEQPVSGPVNVTAPGIVTNAEFTEALARVLHRPAFFAAPAFGLKLVMGEMAAVVLASQRAVPQAVLEAGYKFRYPELRSALTDIFGSGNQKQ